jgi:hypothetical protein
MLIYKNVKGDKCSVESSLKECNKALNPDNDETFLKFERCVNLTFKEYDEKEYINDNICCIEFETTIDNIKNEIKSKISNIPRVDAFQGKVPLPIYIMIAKVIENDPNNEAANIINNFMNDIDNIDVKNKIKKNLDKFRKTSLVKYTFQGKYKIVIYIPNLMKIKKGANRNKYTYFPSLESASQQNKWMNFIVSKKSMYFRAVKQNTDYINEKIENIGKDEYWSLPQEKKNEYLAEARTKNKTNWKNDLLYYELEKTCLNMGCISDTGEDFEELVPKYSKKTEDMNKNSINHTPYYPSKCFQTKNYKNYMFDDSGEGEGDGAEEAMEKKKEFIEKAIELMTEKLESDDNAGSFDTLLKTSISSARNEIYKKAGEKPFEFSKDFNNNILKDFARRNNNFPGIPEMTFRLYKLNQNNNEFKSLFHYMPWGDMLLTQEYVLNEGEIIRMDDPVVDKDTLNVSINQMAFKSFNNRFEIKIKSNGILTVYDNGRDIGALNGAQSINMSAFNNRVLKCELNNIHIYGEDVHEQNDNRGTVQLTIKDSKARIPSSIIVDPRNGSLVIYDLGFNVVN